MPPSFVFAFALASLYGLVFFLVFGQGWLRLVAYWLVSVMGFSLGQWGASVLGLAIFNIGETNLVEGTFTSWLCLLAVWAWRRR